MSDEKNTTETTETAFPMLVGELKYNDSSTQWALAWNADGLVVATRSKPTTDAPKPRWFWGTIQNEWFNTRAVAVGQITAILRRKLVENGTGGKFEVTNFSTVIMSEEEMTAIDVGLNTPTLVMAKDKMARALGNSKRTRAFSSTDMAEISGWLLDGGIKSLKNKDMDALTALSEDALGGNKINARIATIEEGEDAGDYLIMLDGSKFRRFPIWDGTMDQIQLLRTCRENGLAVLLLGPPGTGKTRAAQAAYEKYGYFEISCGESTSYSEMVGGWVPDGKGGFNWEDRALLLSMKARNGKGGVLGVDELYQLDPKVGAESLYQVMVKRYITLPQNPNHPWLEKLDPTDEKSPMVIKAGPEWHVVAMANPGVVGAQISPAMKRRFNFRPNYLTNYDAALEMMGEEFEEIVTVGRLMDERRKNGDVEWAPQMSDLLDYARVTKIFNTGRALSNLLTACELESDREILEEIITATMDISNIPLLEIS